MSSLLTSVFLVQLLCSAVYCSYEPQCLFAIVPEDYIAVPGIGWYKVHPEAATWADAERSCELEGAHLAVINSAAESAAISQILLAAGPVPGSAAPDYTLAGFRYSQELGCWVTLSGNTLEEAGFATWSPGEPNNLNNNEYCGSVRNDNGLLNDISCDAPFGHICEIDCIIFD